MPLQLDNRILKNNILDLVWFLVSNQYTKVKYELSKITFGLRVATYKQRSNPHFGTEFDNWRDSVAKSTID